MGTQAHGVQPQHDAIDFDVDIDFEMDTSKSTAADVIAATERAAERASIGGEWQSDEQKLDSEFSDVVRSPIPTPKPCREVENDGQALYFDIETIPDWEREPTFGLEPVAEQPETPMEGCPDVADVLKKSVADIGKLLSKLNPCDEWLSTLEAAENAVDKSRKGVGDAVELIRRSKAAEKNAGADRIKLLSLTPEYCRIVAIGIAIGNHDVETFVDDGTLEERDLLEAFWERILDCTPIIGFSILQFDLPAVLMRSILLDVPSSRMIDMRPFGNSDVIDLQVARFGKVPKKGFGLKPMAGMMGIDVPAGDMDGSQVYDAWKAKEYGKLGEYVGSDVVVAREMHRSWSGYFCA